MKRLILIAALIIACEEPQEPQAEIVVISTRRGITDYGPIMATIGVINIGPVDAFEVLVRAFPVKSDDDLDDGHVAYFDTVSVCENLYAHTDSAQTVCDTTRAVIVLWGIDSHDDYDDLRFFINWSQ